MALWEDVRSLPDDAVEPLSELPAVDGPPEVSPPVFGDAPPEVVVAPPLELGASVVVVAWSLGAVVADGDEELVAGRVVVVLAGGFELDASRIEALEGARGGGSDGLADPSGSKRHPSTSPRLTWFSAGPSFA